MILICFLGKDCRRDRGRLISARTKEVIRARRASGLPVGRPKGPGKSKLDKHCPEIEALLANGSPQKFIAKRKLTEEARNQETEAVKSYGEFGTFEPLGPCTHEGLKNGKTYLFVRTKGFRTVRFS